MLSYPDFKQKRILIINSIEGQKFSILNDNLLVKDNEGQIIFQDTCYKILSLWIIGNCSITSVLLKKAKKHGFSIFHLQSNFRLLGTWTSATEGNFLLRFKQYNFKNKLIPKRIILNKISNQLALIKEIRNKSEIQKTAINQLESYIEKLNTVDDYYEIMGIEGIASKVFFGSYFLELNWEKRKPRAKSDFINVLLDIGYTFLFYWIENMLNLYGFDVYKGIYHQPFYQRKSLVCDLQEPFRCIIDKAIRKSWNLKQIKIEDFEQIKGQFYIKNDMKKYYINLLIKALIEYKDDLYFYCRDYYRAFIQEKPTENFPFFNIINNK
jgi:CRISPR-associated protein Cas1